MAPSYTLLASPLHSCVCLCHFLTKVPSGFLLCCPKKKPTTQVSRRASPHLHFTFITATPALSPSGSPSEKMIEKTREAARRGNGDKKLCGPSVPPSWEERLRSSLQPQLLWRKEKKKKTKKNPCHVPEEKATPFPHLFTSSSPSPVNSTITSHPNHPRVNFLLHKTQPLLTNSS